jgi:large subunit ribosomal protein L22
MSPTSTTEERPGTRAQVRYVRTSPYKVREVLNLIRGEHVLAADEILAFTERGPAITVRKALKSAVANAENNEGLSADDLVVSACYADEGPTLKRWRPRARGRATRIRKRTCHITIEVQVASPEKLARLRGDSGSGRRGGAAGGDSRRRRVARSRGDEATTEDTSADDAADGDDGEATTAKKAPAKKAKKASSSTKKKASDSEKAVKKAAAKKSPAKKASAAKATAKKAAEKAPAKKTTKKAAAESDSGDADEKDS